MWFSRSIRWGALGTMVPGAPHPLPEHEAALVPLTRETLITEGPHVTIEAELTPEATVAGIERYRSLGLIANPFVVPEDPDDDAAVASEIAAAANLLLKEILVRSREDAPKPLLVLKGEVPSQYALMAMGSTERVLASDETLGVLHAYIPLFTMRVGAARATLNIVAERLAFREFEQVLARFVESVLDEPDEGLATYSTLGAERLDAFRERFLADPVAEVRRVFGEEVLERHPELAGAADLRHADLAVDTDEDDESPEIDDTVGESPGTPMLLAHAAESRDADDRAVFDYLVEYTAKHLSPVVARGLRVHRDRGLAAFAEELKVTKAPRKTLVSLLDLASQRFRKTVFLYDGFDSWLEIPTELRSRIVGVLSEVRWKTAGRAFPVMVLSPGEAPELEETFGASGTIRWEFAGLLPLQESPGELLEDVAASWVEAAALPGASIVITDPALVRIREAAQGSMSRFIRAAAAAIESAADRGLDRIDAIAEAAASETAGSEEAV